MAVQRKNRSIIVSFVLAILALLLFSIPALAAGEEKIGWKKIIDYGYPGYSESGIAWRTYKNCQSHDCSYRFLSWWERGLKRVGTATWTITAPYSGSYKVSVSYRRTENRSPDADFFVTNSDGGEDHFSINQVGSVKYVWKTLGEYHYKKGQKVRVFLNGTDDTYSDCADAASWELVELDPEPILVPANSLLLKK